MKNVLTSFCVVTGLAVLGGCSSYSGTTYGTGTSHEEDTMKSITNLLSIAPKEKNRIDYSARPELVMPANQQALPTPADEGTAQANADTNWPVSPEERILAAREAAPEADERSGDVPLDFQLGEKVGTRKTGNERLRQAAREHRHGFKTHLELVGLDNKSKEEDERARKLRGELAYSTGATRKYLTEPPSIYRTPAQTAEAGETGISKEEIAEAQAQKRAERKDAH